MRYEHFKFSNAARIKSYGVQIFIFEMLISHWSMLWFLLAVIPCNCAVNSFPKWYDTWKSAQKWGYESQNSILVIFLSKPKKIKNPWLGAPGTFFRSPKWYQWTSLKVPEGFLRKKFLGCANSKLVPNVIENLVRGFCGILHDFYNLHCKILCV